MDFLGHHQCFFYWRILAKIQAEKCDFNQYKWFLMGKMVQNSQISKKQKFQIARFVQ
jgi:hypothetical protein